MHRLDLLCVCGIGRRESLPRSASFPETLFGQFQSRLSIAAGQFPFLRASRSLGEAAGADEDAVKDGLLFDNQDKRDARTEVRAYGQRSWSARRSNE